MPKRLSSKEKIKQFLLTRVGKKVTSKQIQRASGGAVEWARRLRELRNEEGWEVLSHNDRKSLKTNEYILVKKPSRKLPPRFSRNISAKLRAQVLDRNGFTCQMCGAAAGDLDEQRRTIRLHVGHIVDKSLGGEDSLDNLRALCSECNQGAKNITSEKPSRKWLLSQVRRAGGSEQRAVYDFLKKKFET